MKASDFENMVNKFCEEMKSNLLRKGSEYAPGVDRLSNFKSASIFRDTIPEVMLWNFVTKHIIALNDFINSLEDGQKISDEQWLEKTMDICCYVGPLLRALLTDRGEL